MDDKTLDELMRARRVPLMRSNLCERIVGAALCGASQDSHNGVRDWVLALVQGLALPRPAVSMAFVVLIGMVMGVGLDVGGFLVSARSDPSGYIQVDDFFGREFQMIVVQTGRG